MTFPIDYILADLCRHITLLPGDVILTGTPANSRLMQLDDVVEVEVTGWVASPTPWPSARAQPRVGHQAQQDTEGILRVAYGGDWWAERDAGAATQRPSTPCHPRRDVLSPS